MNWKKMLENSTGEDLLVTTRGWFYASDGQQYRGVWGRCRIVLCRDAFGFEPRQSTNWFLQVGEGNGAVFVMGCQIHYVQLALRDPLTLLPENTGNTNIYYVKN